MRLSTRQKIAGARAAQMVTMLARKFFGRGPEAIVRRGGITWQLDLREGIEFAIYLLGAFERETADACARLIAANDTVVDIGANIGAHALRFARAVGPGGRVIAVEPTRRSFDRLRRNFALNPELAERATLLQTMLADRPGAGVEPAIYASWPLAGGRDAAHPLHRGVALTTEGADARTLDELLQAHGVAKVGLLKLDVDGHELDVLTGAAATLSRDRPAIVMEMSPYTLEERGQSAADMVSLLGDLGYRFSDLRGRPFDDPDAMLRAIPPGYSINVIARARSAG